MCAQAAPSASSSQTCVPRPTQQPALALAGQPDAEVGARSGGGLLRMVACGTAAQQLWLDPPPDAQRCSLLTDETLLRHTVSQQTGVS